MDVYAVTAGEYEDYEIVFITLDRNRAYEFVEAREESDPESVWAVETYDTDAIKAFDGGKALYRVTAWEDGTARTEEATPGEMAEGYYRVEHKGRMRGINGYSVLVIASNKTNAELDGFSLIHQYINGK